MAFSSKDYERLSHLRCRIHAYSHGRVNLSSAERAEYKSLVEKYSRHLSKEPLKDLSGAALRVSEICNLEVALLRAQEERFFRTFGCGRVNPAIFNVA